MKKPPAIRPVWHYWHRTLLTLPPRSLAARRRQIIEDKEDGEHATRLRLLKYVRGRLPREVLAILSASQNRYGHDQWAAVKRLPRKILDTVYRLHKKECPNCPWDGSTIFPAGR